jgi:putative exosortase-associated protein (TIGR04073 family)
MLIAGTVYADTALKKLGRGVANVATCPFEIYHRVGEVNKENGPIAAFTWGLLKGVYKMGVRGLVGVYEVLSFPMPYPENYGPILTDPEFFLEEGVI